MVDIYDARFVEFQWEYRLRHSLPIYITILSNVILFYVRSLQVSLWIQFRNTEGKDVVYVGIRIYVKEGITRTTGITPRDNTYLSEKKNIPSIYYVIPLQAQFSRLHSLEES